MFFEGEIPHHTNFHHHFDSLFHCYLQVRSVDIFFVYCPVTFDEGMLEIVHLLQLLAFNIFRHGGVFFFQNLPEFRNGRIFIVQFLQIRKYVFILFQNQA